MWCPLEAVCPERVVLAGPETPLAEARRLMEEHGVRALPVVDGELPIGILALEDAGRDGAAPDLEDASNGAPSRHPRGLGGDAPPPS
jgi:CBS domain-containing protein